MSDATVTVPAGQGAAPAGQAKAPVLEVVDLKKHFPIHQGVFQRVVGNVYAVDGVSFTIRRGVQSRLVTMAR